MLALADVREVVEEHALPRYAGAADGLARAAEADCTADALRGPWNAAFDAWMGVSHLRLGSAERDGRAEAIAFWPNERDATGRALERLPAGDDPAALTPEAFAEASVAARGLLGAGAPALRRPYGAGDPACDLARAIAADLAATAEAVEAG